MSDLGLYEKLIVTLFTAIPVAMYYAGSQLSRLAEQVRSIRDMMDSHLDDHENGRWGS